jgi:hypothetical protein
MWLSADPKGFAGADTNLSRYVVNDFVTGWDWAFAESSNRLHFMQNPHADNTWVSLSSRRLRAEKRDLRLVLSASLISYTEWHFSFGSFFSGGRRRQPGSIEFRAQFSSRTQAKHGNILAANIQFYSQFLGVR